MAARRANVSGAFVEPETHDEATPEWPRTTPITTSGNHWAPRTVGLTFCGERHVSAASA